MSVPFGKFADCGQENQLSGANAFSSVGQADSALAGRLRSLFLCDPGQVGDPTAQAAGENHKACSGEIRRGLVRMKAFPTPANTELFLGQGFRAARPTTAHCCPAHSPSPPSAHLQRAPASRGLSALGGRGARKFQTPHLTEVLSPSRETKAAAVSGPLAFEHFSLLPPRRSVGAGAGTVIPFGGGGGQLPRSREQSSLRATQRCLSPGACPPRPHSPHPHLLALLPSLPGLSPPSTPLFGITKCRPMKGVKVDFNKTNITQPLTRKEEVRCPRERAQRPSGRVWAQAVSTPGKQGPRAHGRRGLHGVEFWGWESLRHPVHPSVSTWGN